jgi:prepilin-type processing-associated H-X9-DG protein
MQVNSPGYATQFENPVFTCPACGSQRPRNGYNPSTALYSYISDYPTPSAGAPPIVYFESSYGMNLAFQSDAYTAPSNYVYYKVTQMPQGGCKVPVYMDAVWRDVPPDNTCNPPPDLKYGAYPYPFQGCQRCCINRHNKAVNVSFGDGHVEKVRLPDLWGLTWCPAMTPVNALALPGASVFQRN